MSRYRVARRYHKRDKASSVRTGNGLDVHWRTAMIPATRKVITRKRTRPSQGNHSFMLGIGSIRNPIFALRVVEFPRVARDSILARPHQWTDPRLRNRVTTRAG